MTGRERTPFEDPGGRLWVDTTTWDVRLGGAQRGKVVVADLAVDSVLWSVGAEYRIASPGRRTSLAFTLRHGLAEGLRDVKQPSRLDDVLDLIPSASTGYAGPWSKVGLRDDSTTYDFSVPTGAHVDAADRLCSAGLTIVRVGMIRANANRAVTSGACA